jgi:hypothetical protein
MKNIPVNDLCVPLAEACAQVLYYMDNSTKWNRELVIGEFYAVAKRINDQFPKSLFVGWVEQTERNIERGVFKTDLEVYNENAS